MKYSLTYSGVAIMVLGYLFHAAGVPFVEGNAQIAIQFIVDSFGALITLYGRYRAGGITIFGTRKV